MHFTTIHGLIAMAIASIVSAAPTAPLLPTPVNHTLPLWFHSITRRAAPPPTLKHLLLQRSSLLTTHTSNTSSLPASHADFSPAEQDLPLPRSKRQVLNGPDSRVPVTSTAYPFRAIGRLLGTVPPDHDAVVCSAALVGPRHLAVATHCVQWGRTDVTYRFAPEYNGTHEQFGGAYAIAAYKVETAVDDDECAYAHDFAILVLDARLGDRLGYLGVKAFDSSLLDTPLFYTMGYPGDKDALGGVPYAQGGVSVFNSSSCDGVHGPLKTDADVWHGQSGSPLWMRPDAQGQRYVVGVLSGWYDDVDGRGGRFAAGEELLAVVRQAREEYP